MPIAFSTLERLVRVPDAAMSATVALGARNIPVQAALYDCLRREESIVARAPQRSEVTAILDLVQQASGELIGVCVGRDDTLLDQARDGDWSLRDLLRHAIAVELRYGAQILWSAERRDSEPLAIPDARLPCDRLSPPEPDFADARHAGISRVLQLLIEARRRTDGSLAAVDDGALERPSLWGTIEMSLRMRIHQSAAHLTEVAVQAEKMLAGEPDTEVRRIARRLARLRGAHERWSADAERVALDARYEEIAGVASPE